MIDPKFLDPAYWAHLVVDVLYSVYENGTVVPEGPEPDGVYPPVHWVPKYVLCRLSDSEKRLEGALEVKEAKAGAWGSVFDVTGAGAQVGVIIEMGPPFCGAHVNPDGVHLVGCVDGLPEGSIVVDLFEAKTLKIFSVGPGAPADFAHDVVITTKTRWFRNRNNPKFLGFTKDEKV